MSERESEIKKRKERAAGGGGAVECAEVCMSSEGFQLSQTIGGGKALCMTIGSLTPVKLAGGRTGGVPICLRRERESVCVHLYSAISLVCVVVHTDRTLELLLLFNVHQINTLLCCKFEFCLQSYTHSQQTVNAPTL